MLEAVWSRVTRASRLDRVVIATDDDRIRQAADAFGAETLMTSPDHPSGTDRVAETATAAGDGYEIVVNVQGDEPLVTPSALDALVAAFDDAETRMATLAEPVRDAADLFDPNTVKVVTDARGRALYFSRAPIPYHRGGATRLQADFRDALPARPGGLAGYRRHQGIYAYRRATLLALTALPPSALERDEGLEQLRALEAGVAIRVVDSDFTSWSVDTPEDLRRAADRLQSTPGSWEV